MKFSNACVVYISWLLLCIGTVNVAAKRIINLYRKEIVDGCPPLNTGDGEQAPWKCNRPAQIAGGRYSWGTKCHSRCLPGSFVVPGTFSSIRCSRYSHGPKWSTKPLLCDFGCSPEPLIAAQAHGRWEPTKCVSKISAPGQKCRFKCDKDYVWKHPETPKLTCKPGKWTSNNEDYQKLWPTLRCQPAMNDLLGQFEFSSGGGRAPMIHEQIEQLSDEQQKLKEEEQKMKTEELEEQISEGIEETVDGSKKIYRSTTKTVLVTIIVCLVIITLIAAILLYYFKTRKETKFALVDSTGQQLIPADAPGQQLVPLNSSGQQFLPANSLTKTRVTGHDNINVNCNAIGYNGWSTPHGCHDATMYANRNNNHCRTQDSACNRSNFKTTAKRYPQRERPGECYQYKWVTDSDTISSSSSGNNTSSSYETREGRRKVKKYRK